MLVPIRTTYARAACFWCVVWTCLAGPQIDEKVKETLDEILGTEVTARMVECTNEVKDCDIASAVKDIATIAKLLTTQFADCPSGCSFLPEYCDDFFMATEKNMYALRNKCIAQDDWGLKCRRMEETMNQTLRDARFELGVTCSIISPGVGRRRLPRCDTLVTSITASAPTLSSCDSAWARNECIDHFCGLMAKFRWRIRPRNLQDPEEALDRFPPSFILPGCEDVERYPFDNLTCHDRLDIQSFCDCLCHVVPKVEGVALAECPFNADQYFLFGRLGVEGLLISPFCEDGLCRVLGQQRKSARCAEYDLPAEDECLAMQLPQLVDVACPWLEDSGQDGVLECLDGHRCAVGDDGWDCCEAHRGRGKCPRDTPVMCQTLCGGPGEYCCGKPDACSPRVCAPFLQAEPLLRATTSTTTTTLPMAGARVEKVEGPRVRINRGWWVWLLLVVPVVVGLTLIGIWWRIRRYRDDAKGERRAGIMEDFDRDGGFRRVMAMTEPPPKKRPIVFVELPYLPQVRPLGLELLETKVVRLHQWGKKNGFQVGDVIVDVAGVAVNTFEEIWDRIQARIAGSSPVRMGKIAPSREQWMFVVHTSMTGVRMT